MHALNLLQLTPGGHLGRLIVWSQGAFEQLDTVYGTLTKPSAIKKQGGVAPALPQPMMKNADLSRLINSDEVQSVVNAPKEGTKPKAPKANPLRNKKAMDALNPAAEARAQARDDEAGGGDQEEGGAHRGGRAPRPPSGPEGRQGRRRRQGQVLQGHDRRRLVSAYSVRAVLGETNSGIGKQRAS